jgi:beta-xylosidase
LRTDFPDPFVLRHGAEFLASSTNSAHINLPMASSTDLATWTPLRAHGGKRPHDAMPTLPAWVKRGFTWAPEVIASPGGFILYFTERHAASGRACIGVATATDPRGPFVSTAREPLVCQIALGGTIDANPFRDADGKLYLYYKNDGNAVAKPTDIWAQRLSADGLSVSGEAVPILRNDGKWEAHVIEAPTMVRSPTGYAMFFSANHYGWENGQRLSAYSIGYASCSSPMGPCTDGPGNPILYSFNDKGSGCLSGPGHQSVFKAGGRDFVSFHAWAVAKGCRKAADKRYMYVASLSWNEGKPVFGRSVRLRGR